MCGLSTPGSCSPFRRRRHPRQDRFTVSLLIGDLAFGVGSSGDEHVKVGVLTGSVLAALLATVVLHSRNRAYERTREA